MAASPLRVWRSKQTATAVTEVSVARQPIFGTAGDVTGYELLYRPTAGDRAGSRPRRVVAADIVVRALLNIGLDRLTSGRAAYVNFTRQMLLSGAYRVLPPDGVVIELPEDIEPDDEVETACEHLVDAGYTLALDDFDGGTDFGRLLELATIVKIDVQDRPAAWLDEIASELAPYDVRLLAERVETPESRAVCAGLGYELFQGYYYARPEVIRTRSLASDELSIIHAMNALRDARGMNADWETGFSTDVGVSDRLLRVLNVAARGARRIESIAHAVGVVGHEELGKWLALLLVSSIAARESANRELLHLAIQRARLCELLAVPAGRGRDGNALFLLGLFSVLDAISGMPMAALLEPIALADPLRDALIERTGPYAAPLDLVEAYEQGQWGAVTQRASSAGLHAAEVGTRYVQSLVWTRERLMALSAG